MTDIHRNSTVIDITVATSLGSAEPIPFHDYSAGLLLVPAGASAATITFYCSDDQDGTFYPLEQYDATVDLTVDITASTAKELPPQLFGAHWIKIVPDAVSGGSDSWKMTCKS